MRVRTIGEGSSPQGKKDEDARKRYKARKKQK